MVAAAVIGGAALSSATSLGTGLMQSGNAGKAGAQAQRNLQLMLPQIQQNYVDQQGLYQPFYGAGQQGLGVETDLLGLNGPDAAAAAMGNFQASPGYQYQLQQGLRGVDAGAAAQGMLRSGATLKAEQTLGSNLANLDFGNYYGRLNALAGGGLTAAGGLATSGNNLIAGMQGNATSQNALAIGGANAQNSILGNTASGIGNTLNSLLQNKDVQQLLGFTGSGSSLYGTSAPGTPGISASGNPVMSGFIGNQNIGSQGAYIPPALSFS